MATQSSKNRWAEIKARLRTFDRDELLAVVGTLYRANGDIRRFLHLRLLGSASEIEQYRQMIEDAVYPDPFSKRPIRVGEAKWLIGEYGRAADDPAGTLDLMLTFIEAGTEQAADLGVGEDAYFTALCTMLGSAEKLIRKVPTGVMDEAATRLSQIAIRASVIGWGYGDYAAEVAARVTDFLNRTIADRGQQSPLAVALADLRTNAQMKSSSKLSKNQIAAEIAATRRERKGKP